jgi:transposase
VEALSLGERMESVGTRRSTAELRERAVRLVYEWREARDRRDGGLKDVGQQLGVHPETVRNWIRQHEIDGGQRAGLRTDEKERIKQLERENFELRRANEILKSAAAFFGAELDRRPKR